MIDVTQIFDRSVRAERTKADLRYVVAIAKLLGGSALKCAISFFIIGVRFFGAFYAIAAYCLPKNAKSSILLRFDF